MSKRSGKIRRTARYRYLVADPDEARAAGAEAVAQSRLAEMRARDTPEHAAAARRRREAEKALEKAVEDCYGTIVLRALSPEQQQAFAQQSAERDDAHAVAVKMAEAQDEAPPAAPELTWDEDSFEVQLLAACDLDNAHTAKWWAQEFAGDEWTLPERDELLQECYRLNQPRQSYDLGVLGKG